MCPGCSVKRGIVMIYIFLAEGFEEIEALAPLDLLRRAGLSVTTVGIGGEKIRGAHGIEVRADWTDQDFMAFTASSGSAPFEMLVLPGGMPGTKHLDASVAVEKALRDAQKADAFIAAICAAPMILGKRGLLREKTAVCYPGFEEYLTGATIGKAKVVRDGKIITAMGMGVAVNFGLALVEALCGKDTAEKLRSSVIAG